MKNAQKKKIRRAKTTLAKIMQTLEPFLPPPDLTQMPPPREWKSHTNQIRSNRSAVTKRVEIEA